MKKVLEVITKYFDIFITLMAAAAISLYEFFGNSTQENVLNAILVILALIALNLLKNRLIDNSLQQKIDRITVHLADPSAKLKLDRIIELLSNPPASQIFSPHSEYQIEVRAKLEQAKEIWVLSRTGSSFWQEYNIQLMNLRSNKDSIIKLVTVDPRNGAVRMIKKYTEFEHENEAKLVKDNLIAFLKDRNKKQRSKSQGKLFTRVIDYLPPWSLFIIDPNTEKGIIYVELATFAANSTNRPTFSLTYEKDIILFNQLIKCTNHQSTKKLKQSLKFNLRNRIFLLFI